MKRLEDPVELGIGDPRSEIADEDLDTTLRRPQLDLGGRVRRGVENRVPDDIVEGAAKQLRTAGETAGAG